MQSFPPPRPEGAFKLVRNLHLYGKLNGLSHPLRVQNKDETKVYSMTALAPNLEAECSVRRFGLQTGRTGRTGRVLNRVTKTRVPATKRSGPKPGSA